MKTNINVLFLDIDGVLYPCRNRRSFTLDPNVIRKRLSEEKNLTLEEINDSTLLSVYEGFSKEAIQYLQTLSNQTNLKIIISSNWKFRFSLSTLRKMFAIYDIEIYDVIPNHYGILKSKYIKAYINDHPEIADYIILDDVYMSHFPHHFIKCNDVLDYNNFSKILKKFKNKC